MWGATFACKSSIAEGNPQLIALRRYDFVPKSSPHPLTIVRLPLAIGLFESAALSTTPSGAPSPEGEGFGAVRNLTNKHPFLGQVRYRDTLRSGSLPVYVAYCQRPLAAKHPFVEGSGLE